MFILKSLPFEFLSHWICLLLVFKRGTGQVGAFHTSDITEFYGLSASPDFIGTDALGMFSNLLLLLVWFDAHHDFYYYYCSQLCQYW